MSAKEQPQLHPDMYFRDAAQRVLAPRLEKVFAHEAGARAGEDIEEVHDMRVASRRLRAAMTIFAPCMPKRRFKPLKDQARQLTQALGMVRDADVLLDAIGGDRAKASEDEAPGLDDLIAVVRQEREAHRAAMLEAFDTANRKRFRQHLEVLLEDSRYLHHGDLGRERLAVAAQRICARRIADLYGFVPSIHDPVRKEELHEMRKAAKRLRYSMEIFQPCFGPDIDDRIADVKTVQEHIGQIHDCDVLIEIVRGRLAVHAQQGLETLLNLAAMDIPLEQRLLNIRDALSTRKTDARPGLLALLTRKHAERDQRYNAFIAWWDKHERRGLRTALYQCIALSEQTTDTGTHVGGSAQDSAPAES